MNTVLDIGRLTRAQKLRAMEELWTDLSRAEEQYQTPEWHGDVLRDRERAVEANTDGFIPWEDAKRLLREKPRGESSSCVLPSKTWRNDATSTTCRAKASVITSRSR
jgi:hypothetical protein